MNKTQQERVLARRQLIEERVAAVAKTDKEVDVGLKAVHNACDYWAIDGEAAEAILFGVGKTTAKDDRAHILERLSYVLRIHRLIHEVVQGDQTRHQRWIRQSIPSLNGERPLDLMVSGPIGSAKVMEYLEFYKHGHSG